MASLSPPANESQRLEALRAYDILDTPPEDAFDRVTRLTAQWMDVPISTISFLENDRQWFKSCRGISFRETSREHAFCAHNIYDDTVMVVEDATQDGRFADNPLVTGEPGIRFYAGAPLITPDGHILGSLCAIDTQPREASSEDLDVLRDLAQVVVSELELRLRNQKLREQNRQIKSLTQELRRAEETHRSELSELVQEELQQVLQAARMQVESLRAGSDLQDGHGARLHRVLEMLDDAGDVAERVMSHFAPAVGTQPLRETLEWLTVKMRATHGLSVSIDGNGTGGGSDEDLKMLLYQVVRELLFRIVTDADTNAVHVRLSETPESLCVTVEDDGRGFDLSRDTEVLAGLWDQIEERRGRLEASTCGDGGTCVTIEVPKRRAGYRANGPVNRRLSNP